MKEIGQRWGGIGTMSSGECREEAYEFAGNETSLDDSTWEPPNHLKCFISKLVYVEKLLF